MSFPEALQHLYIYALPLSRERIDYYSRQATWTIHDALHLSVGLDPGHKDSGMPKADAAANGNRILANWKAVRKDMANETISYRLMNCTPPDVTPSNKFKYILFDAIDFVSYASKLSKFPVLLAKMVLSAQEKFVSKQDRPANALLTIQYAEKNEHKEFIRRYIRAALANPLCSCDSSSLKQYIEMSATNDAGNMIYDSSIFSENVLQAEVTAAFTEMNLLTRIKGLKGYKKPATCTIHPTR